MKLPEPMKQLSDDYIRGWNECLQAVRDLNNTEEKPDADGWIPWSYACDYPHVSDSLVIVRFRDGTQNNNPHLVHEWVWRHDDAEDDIVAYKVVG